MEVKNVEWMKSIKPPLGGLGVTKVEWLKSSKPPLGGPDSYREGGKKG